MQQAIDTATAGPAVGFIILADNAPDVVATPALARYLWMETASGIATGNAYYYNGSSWSLLVVLSGASIINGSITLNKLTTAGALPYDIIQVNSSATGYVFTQIADAIPAGSLNISLLTPAGGSTRFLLGQDTLNNIVFYDLATIAGFFANGTITLPMIVAPAASTYGYVLFANPDGTREWRGIDLSSVTGDTMIADGTIALNKLVTAGATPFSVLRRNAANDNFEYANLGQEALAVGYSNAVTATIDVVLTKPSGKTWNKFEVSVDAKLQSSDGSGSCTVTAITFQTAPSVGVAVGQGNTGVVFTPANNDFSPAFWKVAGNAPAGLSDDNVTIRIAVTLVANCTLQQALTFARGYYY